MAIDEFDNCQNLKTLLLELTCFTRGQRWELLRGMPVENAVKCDESLYHQLYLLVYDKTVVTTLFLAISIPHC